MYTWKTYYVEIQRLEDETSLAQQANLEGHIMMHNPVQSSIANRLLVLLGAQLIAWGYNLQNRCADMTTHTPTHSMRSNA